MTVPWWCPVCQEPLTAGGGALSCPAGHSFDIARQGYVNLLRGGRRRPGGDSKEMVDARQAFLASGAYEPVSDALNRACAPISAATVVLDVGCGEGYYTRRLPAPGSAQVCGVDLSKPAVAAAAARHRAGLYAVASAFDLPLPPGSIDVVVSVFGPIAVPELARVLRPGGRVIAVHPGSCHLFALRAMVYDSPEPHAVKDPLRSGRRWFAAGGRTHVRYSLEVPSPVAARQLLTMTPYRWHAPRDIDRRLADAGGLDTEVDVFVSTYHRRPAQRKPPDNVRTSPKQ